MPQGKFGKTQGFFIADPQSSSKTATAPYKLEITVGHRLWMSVYCILYLYTHPQAMSDRYFEACSI